jgi:hypothetical protein
MSDNQSKNGAAYRPKAGDCDLAMAIRASEKEAVKVSKKEARDARKESEDLERAIKESMKATSQAPKNTNNSYEDELSLALAISASMADEQFQENEHKDDFDPILLEKGIKASQEHEERVKEDEFSTQLAMLLSVDPGNKEILHELSRIQQKVSVGETKLPPLQNFFACVRQHGMDNFEAVNLLRSFGYNLTLHVFSVSLGSDVATHFTTFQSPQEGAIEVFVCSFKGKGHFGTLIRVKKGSWSEKAQTNAVVSVKGMYCGTVKVSTGQFSGQMFRIYDGGAAPWANYFSADVTVSRDKYSVQCEAWCRRNGVTKNGYNGTPISNCCSLTSVLCSLVAQDLLV